MQIRKLNTLRGLAALIVAVSHYSNESGLWSAVLGSGAGQLGVMLFFLLSGFLMAYLYLDKPPTAINVGAFLVARCARVVPLFLVVLFLAYFLALVFPAPAAKYFYGISSVPILTSHLLLLWGNNVLWTIPVEIHLYALFALVWILRPRLGTTLYAIVGLTVAVRFCLGYQEIPSAYFGLTILEKTSMAFPYFVAGALMGQLYRRWQPKISSHYFVLALLIVPALYPAILNSMTGLSHGLWEDWLVLVLMSFAFFALVFLVPEGNVMLENKAGDFVGKISYSIYLLHFPVIRLWTENGLANGVSGLVSLLAVVLTFAWVSYVLVENPARKAIRGESGAPQLASRT